MTRPTMLRPGRAAENRVRRRRNPESSCLTSAAQGPPTFSRAFRRRYASACKQYPEETIYGPKYTPKQYRIHSACPSSRRLNEAHRHTTSTSALGYYCLCLTTRDSCQLRPFPVPRGVALGESHIELDVGVNPVATALYQRRIVAKHFAVVALRGEYPSVNVHSRT